MGFFHFPKIQLPHLDLQRLLGREPAPSSPVSRSPSAAPVDSYHPAPAPGTNKASLDPMAVLGQVKSGNMEISLPMKPGSFGPGKVKPGTTAKLTASVVDGKVDLRSVKLDFSPDLDGPAWANVRGAKITDGRLTLDVAHAPDLQLGPQLSTNPEELTHQLSGALAGDVDVHVWGTEVAKASTHDGGFHLTNPFSGSSPIGWLKQLGTEVVTGADYGAAAGVSWIADKIHHTDTPPSGAPDLRQLQFKLTGVALKPGAFPIGVGSDLRLGAGSRLDIVGTPNDITATGHVNVANLDVDAGGVKITGGRGSTDLNVHFTRGADGQGQVDTQLSNMDVHADTAVSHRANGDYIALAQGQLNGASLALSQNVRFTNGLTVGNVDTKLSRLDIDDFSGTITDGQITFKDDRDTAQVKIGRSTVSHGSVRVRPDRIQVEGDLDGSATVKDFQLKRGPASLDIKQARINGRGEVSFDSRNGVSVRGADLDVDAQLNRASVDGSVPGVGHVSVAASAGTKAGLKLRGLDLDALRLVGLDGVAASVDSPDISAKAADILATHVKDLQLQASLGKVDGAEEDVRVKGNFGGEDVDTSARQIAQLLYRLKLPFLIKG